MMATLLKRQDAVGDGTGAIGNGSSFEDDGDVNDARNGVGDYYDREGEIIRYVVVAVLLFSVLFLIFFGMWHAKKRVRQGKAPLMYHRWLIHPKHRPLPGQTYQQSWPQDGSRRAPFPTGQQYQMQDWNYAPPPPVYAHDAPPGYAPPEGPPPGREAKGPSGPANTTNQTAGETWRAA